MRCLLHKVLQIGPCCSSLRRRVSATALLCVFEAMGSVLERVCACVFVDTNDGMPGERMGEVRRRGKGGGGGVQNPVGRRENKQI